MTSGGRPPHGGRSVLGLPGRAACVTHPRPMSKPAKSYWTFGAFREGAVATFPLMPGLFAFGMAFGTVAARKGFSLLDAELDERHRFFRRGADHRGRRLAAAADRSPRYRPSR